MQSLLTDHTHTPTTTTTPLADSRNDDDEEEGQRQQEDAEAETVAEAGPEGGDVGDGSSAARVGGSGGGGGGGEDGSKIAQLVEMLGCSRDKAQQALDDVAGSVEEAVIMLMSAADGEADGGAVDPGTGLDLANVVAEGGSRSGGHSRTRRGRRPG
jgi:hypothetical protein